MITRRYLPPKGRSTYEVILQQTTDRTNPHLNKPLDPTAKLIEIKGTIGHVQ